MLRYEHRSQPLLPRSQFLLRVVWHVLFALGLLLLFLALGTIGYHYFVQLAWIDAVLNASMILSGMGPVDTITMPAGKTFATIYALISGIVFALTTGIIISPIVHRVFHSMHVKDDDDD